MDQSAPTVSRRRLLRGGAVVAAGAATAGTGLAGLFGRSAHASPDGTVVGNPDSSYGPLIPKRPVTAADPAHADRVYLALPEDFQYTVFGVEGHQMSDGNPTPLGHDGTAAFLLPDGRIRLVRNHEDRYPPDAAWQAGGALTHPAYDRAGRGATTTLEIGVGGAGPIPTREFISIAGTIVNCAGGPTPWGSWLTCEETTAGRVDGWGRDHGYVFEVPAGRNHLATPVPLTAMGRFTHEAAAVDPATSIVYETEDRDTAGFYRYVPHRRGILRAGGRLQMLAIDGDAGADLRRASDEGITYPVRWVDIDDPDPTDPGEDGLAVYRQGRARGGATFTRLEGCWFGNGAIYINSTDGGPDAYGQVWEYRPSSHPDFGELILLVVADNPGVLDAPDNITVSDRGGVLSCEDGPNGNSLRGVRRDGTTYDFAHNEINQRETTGACFVTSAAFRNRFPGTAGQMLFFNIQGDLEPGGPGNLGHTFAVWGPWQNGSL